MSIISKYSWRVWSTYEFDTTVIHSLFLLYYLSDLLIAWAHAIVAERNDVAIVLGASHFEGISCAVPSNGTVSEGGWHCLFAPMPHLCTFVDDTVRNRFLFLSHSRTYPKLITFHISPVLNLATR